MSEQSATCWSGCTLTGQHSTTCSDGQCRGCLPRPVEEGTLCAWCWRRLRATIAEIPSLVAHLREIGRPYAQTLPPSDGRSAGDPAESTVLPRAWLEADELESQVTSWAHAVIDDSPQVMRGPNAAPWYGDTIGWITPHLSWCATQPWAEVMLSELTKDTARLKATWPTPDMVERERHVPVPCPRCDRLSLHYVPPTWAHQPFRVWCDNPDCARAFSEDEWERFKALALDTGRRTA